MKDIHAIKGRHYILSLIGEGEHEHQDFKFAITDARKIARSISAFSNNDGGRLLIGVKDNGVVAGIRNEEDIYMIETAAAHYCRPAVDVRTTAFKVGDGLVVLRAEIPKALRPPVYVLEEGNVEKAYYRVKDENVIAPEVLLSAWSHYSRSSGALLRLDDTHRKLIAMIEERGSITVEEFVVRSHIPTDSAIDLIGRLAASSVVNLHHDGQQMRITL